MSNVDNKKPPLAVIFGMSGKVLTDDEKALFKQSNPLGFILFKRNLEDSQQVKDLVKSLHECMGRNVPILIDQEGGRVQRMRPPHWGNYAAAAQFEAPYLKNYADGEKNVRESTARMAKELLDHGINVNCAPVLDVRYPETHDAIGDRAFSTDPMVAAALASFVADEHLKQGVLPIIKHIPGQGRAESDSHLDLPEVKSNLAAMRQTDFIPYKELLTKAFSEAVWGMVAHVVYTDIDPQAPATCSRKVIDDTIRRELGFDGLLLSDDICMGALNKYGDAGMRAEKVLRAGCDIALHCNGDLAEMQSVAARAPKMSDDAVRRYNVSAAWLRRNYVA